MQHTKHTNGNTYTICEMSAKSNYYTEKERQRKERGTQFITVKPVYSGHFNIDQRFINTPLYCIGTDTTCPDYRGVLILECPQ